ncbi:MAG: extracellular solute-binding protein [SAR324 cluster bacterium]|nr:extracellular solute-binding protein [SAR324 cluster bacterium]
MREKSRNIFSALAKVVTVGALVVSMATIGNAQELTIIGHKVHERVSTGKAGGDFAGEWAAAKNTKINWLTFNVQAVHERLFREASLGSTTIDVGFAANRYYKPQFPEMFQALDDYLASAPIKDFDELPKGMLGALTYGGKLYGIPFRHATAALHVNTAILKEKGVAVPKTFEELLSAARKLTFTRSNGTKVHGLLLDYRSPAILTDFARAMNNGDFLTPDFELKANSPDMIGAVEEVVKLFKEGVLPEAFLNFKTEDVITYMQQERAAMAISPFGRYRNFNDAKKSKAAGKIISIAVPKSEKLEGFNVAPIRTEFWAMLIPKNSDNKDLAWDYIRNSVSPENTIRAAVNGNGPIRPSAYADQRVKDLVPYASDEQAALSVARPPLPGFTNSARVEDIFIEEVESALLGLKTTREALDSVQARSLPLLPSK